MPGSPPKLHPIAAYALRPRAEKPGTGLGAACEALNLRQRIYDKAGVNEDIRVVLFDDADAAHISVPLKPYHHFHAERDFADIVRWLGGTLPPPPPPASAALSTIIPHNLPRIQPFFGRQEELRRIAEALEPERRDWGAIIDGPGGMGKTSLAVRAAYSAPSHVFNRIIFASLKRRELDDDGVQDLSGFLLTGLQELYNEIASLLGQSEIAKAPEDQRPRLLLNALNGTQTLLILDNLESLIKAERTQILNFAKRLPQGCKAILTCRGRIGSGAEELILEKLSQEAALQTLAEIATRNKLLAATSEAERIVLYTQTAGKPLLLRWTAGQLGRGHCVTFIDALKFLRSCPPDNDPLEFIFGDLVKDFNDLEKKVLCALTYFTLPAKVEHITELAYPSTEAEPRSSRREEALEEEAPAASIAPQDQSLLTSAATKEQREQAVTAALNSLSNRSLVVPDRDSQTFTLVPMVAEFLRRHQPEVVRETGDRLENYVFALVVENGYQQYDRFPVLDAAWPTVAAALPQFRAGLTERLQTICDALRFFLDFTGRWDERLSLSLDAEPRAVEGGDFHSAGWRAYEAGWIHGLRGQSAEVLACAGRAADHFQRAQAGAQERASALRLQGIGHEMNGDYATAMSVSREALALWRSVSAESRDVALGLNELASAERRSGDLEAAERYWKEALRMAHAINDPECISIYTGQLATLALDREDWAAAETLAQEALLMSERLGRQRGIAFDCHHLALALLKQDRKAGALTYAHRAVAIFTTLRSPHLEASQDLLAECEAQ